MKTAKPTIKKMKLEIHEHSFISGPNANGPNSKFSHSHSGGNIPHEHPETGPSCYTIDKDEWRKATGLRGGGRKKFTAEPTGKQMEWIPLTHEQSHFTVHADGVSTIHEIGGAIGFTANRMVQQFGMTPILKGGAQ